MTLCLHTCVQLPVVHIPCGTVCQDKGFHPPLCGFVWQVLNEGQPFFEANHCFIYRDLTVHRVGSLEVDKKGLKERSELVEAIVTTRLTLWNVGLVVIEVDKLHEEAEAVTL